MRKYLIIGFTVYLTFIVLNDWGEVRRYGSVYIFDGDVPVKSVKWLSVAPVFPSEDFIVFDDIVAQEPRFLWLLPGYSEYITGSEMRLPKLKGLSSRHIIGRYRDYWRFHAHHDGLTKHT